MPLPWLNDNAPWWAQMGILVLGWLGPAAIVAGIFLAMWTGWLPSPITDNNKILTRVEHKLDAAVLRMTDEVRSSGMKDEQVVRLLLATCRNVSRSDIDRSQCDSYWKR
jgi:hypothetical protein